MSSHGWFFFSGYGHHSDCEGLRCTSHRIQANMALAITYSLCISTYYHSYSAACILPSPGFMYLPALWLMAQSKHNAYSHLDNNFISA
jgi:hypothetical protein